MTSAEPATKINNVKIWLREGSFLCTVPKLDWTSVETVAVRFEDFLCAFSVIVYGGVDIFTSGKLFCLGRRYRCWQTSPSFWPDTTQI